MLALAGCACILFAEVIKQWKSIFGFLGNVVSAMTPIIIGLVIAFMLNPIMIYIRRGLSFLICKIKKEAEYDRVYKKVKVPALILTVLLFLGLLVGVNLLREGLDLPEVSLVAILDADKEGFLRSHRSLTQTAGRAARNVNGKVIMYADRITDSMRQTIDETNRRREKQLAYNEAHGITPKQITRSRANALLDIEKQSSQENSSKPKEPRAYTETEAQLHAAADPVVQYMTKGQLQKSIEQTRKLMQEAAKKLDFIEAAQYRDELLKLEELLKEKS